MKEELKKTADIQPGDIIFECPQCSKSLAIDPRGAGYTVICPDCAAQVQVPASDEGASLGVGAEGMRHRIEAREKISGELVLIQAALDRISLLLQDSGISLSGEEL